MVRGLAAVCRCPGTGKRDRNPETMDLREIAGSGGLGQDALQPTWPGRSLVSRRECEQGRWQSISRRVAAESICRQDSGHSQGSARDALRKTGEEVERELKDSIS